MPTRRRRSVAALALVGVTATAVGVGSLATFTDTESTPNNRFTAGTLDLTVGPQSQAWTVDNMAPGDVEYRAITVGNAGSLPLEYDASVTLASQVDAATQTHPGSPANGGLGEALHLTYRGALSGGASCGPAVAAATETSAFVPSTPQAIDLLAPTRTLAAGASEQLCFSFGLPLGSDNRYQGDSANFTLAFSSQQAGRDSANQPVAAAVAPMTPTATAGDASARVSYPAVSGADRYTVRVAAQDGRPARTIDASGSSVDVTGLTNSTPYQFTVRAYSGSRVIAQGSTAVVTPMSTPAAVEGLTANVPTDGSITATWTSASNSASVVPASYDIKLLTEDGTVVATTSVGAGMTSYAFTGLALAPKYVITVTPRNASGAGAARSTSPMLAYLAPPALTGLTPVASGLAGVAKVTFDRPLGAQVTGVDFAVFGEDGSSASASTAADSTSATLSALNPNTRYRVEARVRNAVGSSSVASTPYFSILTAPAPVRSLSALSSGSGSIAASWTDPGADAQHDTASGYDITLSRNGTLVKTTSAASTSVSFTGLASGGGYTVNVVAKNAAGLSSAMSTTAEAGGYGAAPVTALSGTPVAGGGITLNWAASAVDGTHDAATSYVVELRDGSNLVKTTTVTTTSAVFTDLPSGSNYTAVVKAVNAAATSAPTSVAVTAGGYVSSPVTNLTPVTGAGGVITASWNAPVVDGQHDAASSYDITLSRGGSVVKTTTATTTSVSFTGLPSGADYILSVTAKNAVGAAAAVTATAEAGGYTPAAPTALTGTPSAGGGLTLNWTASIVDATHDPVTSYVAELRNGSTVVNTATVTATTASFSGLPSGSTYTAAVRAVNSAGTSSAATSSVTAGSYLPNAVTNLTAVTGSNGVVTASWTASAADATHDAATSYRARLLKGAVLVQDMSSTATTATFTPVGAGSYTVEIAAINSAGTGPVTTAAATVSSAYSPTVMADAPLAYLKLDDAAAPLVDSSGNGKNGVVAGTLSYRQAPLVSDSGYSIGFTRDTGSSINLPNLPINTSTTSFNTMESWADFATMDPSRPYYLYQVTRGYHLIAFKGCFGFNTGGGDVYGVPMSTISSGTHHVTAVFANHTRNNSKLYIDGVQQTLSACYGGVGSSGPDYVTGDDISLSTKYDAGNASWPSKVDNFAVYKGELSAARVLAHYNSGR